MLSMSMRKSKGTDPVEENLRKEFFHTLTEKKFQTIGLVTYYIAWIVCFIVYSISLYELLMIIFSLIYVTYYFYSWILFETRFSIAMEVLNQNPDFRKLQEEIEKT